MILVIAGVLVVLAVLIALRERHHARRLRAVEAELQQERERTAQLTAAEERARVAREAYELERSGGATAQPGLGELPSLVERARAAGMPVTLSVEGNPPRQLPAVLDVSAFRIVQEALRNVHRHAHGQPASVRVIWHDDALDVHVRNTGGPAETGDDGRGMTVIRERVAFHGGDLRAGTLPHGGYEVAARLPL